MLTLGFTVLARDGGGFHPVTASSRLVLDDVAADLAVTGLARLGPGQGDAVSVDVSGLKVTRWSRGH